MGNAVSKAQFSAETGDDGSFKRQESAFRRWVKSDGSSEFTPEKDRYHLYVSYACPWAHRAIIYRKLKGLEDIISMDVVDPIRDEKGWRFSPGESACDADSINGFDYLSKAYTATDSTFSGRVTVPVLWDKKTSQIVNNESSEIIRILNSEFNEWGNDSDFYPSELREKIDETNTYIYDHVNNGVYKSGFATIQSAYEKAVTPLFESLDKIDSELRDQRFLCGDTVTEADWRFFTTLVRFDPVYVGHFKCNKKRIVDYKEISRYLKELCEIEGVRETINLDHIKRHYYVTHTSINPTGIVPVGPDDAIT